MSMLKIRIEQLLGLTRSLENAHYTDTDYDEIRQNLRLQFPSGSIPASEITARKTVRVRKAPSRIAFEKYNLRRIPGFKISQKDLFGFVGKECTITFYGPGNEPLFRRGRIIELYPRYLLLETHISVRHYYIQFFRIIKIVEFEGRHTVKEIWYDKKPH